MPKILKEATIYTLEMATLLAGTRYRGVFEERLNGILKIVTSDTNKILFIDFASLSFSFFDGNWNFISFYVIDVNNTTLQSLFSTIQLLLSLKVC